MDRAVESRSSARHETWQSLARALQECPTLSSTQCRIMAPTSVDGRETTTAAVGQYTLPSLAAFYNEALSQYWNMLTSYATGPGACAANDYCLPIGYGLARTDLVRLSSPSHTKSPLFAPPWGFRLLEEDLVLFSFPLQLIHVSPKFRSGLYIFCVTSSRRFHISCAPFSPLFRRTLAYRERSTICPSRILH
jgi:hypothetical protein